VSTPVVRPIAPDEIDLFTSFADASPLGLKPPLEMYLDGLRTWYRPAWSWVALRDGEVVARVAFSGPPDAELPLVMGSLEIGTRPDRVATGVAMVRTAYAAMTGGGTGEGGRPEYRQFLPVDWREHAGMRAAVEDRRGQHADGGVVRPLRVRGGRPADGPRLSPVGLAAFTSP
jgi:hypothetical protein